MAFLSIPNVAIKGISACVPPKVEENRDLPFYSAQEAEKVIEATGVERKHIADDSITASDLCFKACKCLLDKLGWESDSIDLICNVTQTSDYVNHPNVFVLHEKLGLKNDCMALDLFHGCPGWVIGLSSVASLVSLGSIKRALLLDGDTISRIQYAYDHESRPLFGDCGTATAVEFDESASPLLFQTGTNSVDGKALIKENGAFRKPFTVDSFIDEQEKLLGKRQVTEEEQMMDGMSVFSFGITAPPKSMKQLCEHFGKDLQGIDKIIIHQANQFMVNKIARKLKVDMERVPSSLREYGNTTSATIPLTIVSQCGKEYEHKKLSTIACGFGTGLSWATVYFESENMICPDVIIY